MNRNNIKSKFHIVWSMRKWPIKYIHWRLITAYPEGLIYVFKHPFVFVKDVYKYIIWCQEFDKEINA